MLRFRALFLLLLSATTLSAQGTALRKFTPEDVLALKNVGDAQISPAGTERDRSFTAAGTPPRGSLGSKRLVTWRNSMAAADRPPTSLALDPPIVTPWLLRPPVGLQAPVRRYDDRGVST